jgi:DNA-binding MarR family transcriptional regulator
MSEREPVGRRAGYLIKRAQQALRNAMDRALREHGLTTPQYAILSFLAEEPDLSSAELARRAFVTPQTMNEILTKLAADGLVARSAHPRHGRILQTRLTDAGARALEACHACVDAIEAQMVSALDGREQHQLVRALERCIEALEPVPAPATEGAVSPTVDRA